MMTTPIRGFTALLAFLLSGCIGSEMDMRAPVFEGERVVKPSRHQAAPRYYFVKPGDTLYSIAWRENIDYRTLAIWNRLPSDYTIHPGQRLILSSPGVSFAPTPRVAEAPPPASQRGPVAQPVKQPQNTAVDNRTVRRNFNATTASLRWSWPTHGNIVSHYAAEGITKKGIRITGKEGQPVLAAAGGKVVYSGTGLIGYGRLIIVKHNEYYLSAYGNNRKILVKEGQAVVAGQKVAEMGQSDKGLPLLHFEIRYRGKPVDPVRMLPKR